MPTRKIRDDKPRKKPLRFVGSAHKELCSMPEDVKDLAGQLLLDVQYGDTPTHSKPMEHIGPGTMQLEVDEGGGWFRVFYVAKFPEAVYVLHVFQKKTNQTARSDNDKGITRYQQLSAYRSTLT